MPQLPRRDVLKALAAAAVSLGLDPFRGVTVDSDEYGNHRLGLHLRKPRGWEFESVADFAALRERQVLQSLLTDEAHPLKEPSNLPVFMLFDPAHRYGEFAPAISLWEEALDHPVPDDEAAAHRLMLWGFTEAYRDVAVLEEPRRIEVVGSGGTESVWRYLHELDDGQAWALRVRSIIVFRPPRVHTYHLVDRTTHPSIPKATFDTFIQSIEYAAP